MNALDLRKVSLQAGDFLVRSVSLAVPAGEYFILMGHTGAGKTLLMKAVCGVQPLTEGRVVIGDQDVTDLPPRDRRIGYVPQDSALFPHADVRDNISFALDLFGLDQDETATRTQAMAEELGIVPLLSRKVGGLSGGEKQKVAIARALTRKPRLLLLDEPVSALDEGTHDEICGLLKRVHVQHALTTVHICHNRREAERLGDRIGVMKDGELVEIDGRSLVT